MLEHPFKVQLRLTRPVPRIELMNKETPQPPLSALQTYLIGHLLGTLQSVEHGAFLYYANGATELNGRHSEGGVAEELIAALRPLGIAGVQLDQLEQFLQRNRTQGPFYVTLSGQGLADFRVAVEKVQSVYAMELQRRDFAEPVLPQGGMNYLALRERKTGVFFPNGIPSEVPALTKEDLDFAIDCLVAGLPTPAAMVALRAAEGMLRATYRRLTGSDPAAKAGWGAVEEGLVAHVRPGHASLGDSLEHHLAMVRRIRNEAEHPQVSYSQLMAENAVNQAVFLIQTLAQAKGILPPAQDNSVGV
jgi:hypothetical protein